MLKIQNFINGELTQPNSGNYFDNTTSVTGKVYSQIPNSDVTDIDIAVSAAKIAFKFYEYKEQENEFTLADLYRVERIHYYDNSYNMAYVPERFENFLRPLIHDSRAPAMRIG